MNSLPTREFARLQCAILELYSHRDIKSFRQAVPGIFLSQIAADYFSLGDGRIDVANRSVRILNIWESRPVRTGKLLEALERNMFDHPFVQHALRHGLRGAVLLSDFVTLPQLRRTKLYREALKPAGMGRILSIGSLSGPGLASLTLTRPETDRDFSARDRLVLELLRPHFDQARSNLERETMLRATQSGSLKVLGLTPRETDVALWLAQGKSNAEIGIILAAPVRTVEKHVERILAKLGADHRAAAAVMIAGIVGA